MWYGASSVIPRLLNYLLTPYLTLKLNAASYGDMTLVYALISFLTILYTYGLETSYFRFSQKPEYSRDLYNTVNVSIISSTLLLTVILWTFAQPLAEFTNIPEHPEYIKMALLIVSFEALAAIPFARLRQEGRPRKYAFVKFAAVLVNIGVLYFCLSVAPRLAAADPNSIFTLTGSISSTAYVFLANIVMCVVVLILLWKEIRNFRWKFNFTLWKEIIIYTAPLLIVGFGGMINETMDRLMLGWWYHPANGNVKDEIGTYGAVYKLAILITVFIQAFRMGAEPFFFKQASGENPQRTYARVMKFFVITVCLMFLFVSLYLDIWKYFIQNEKMWSGLKVVPVLLVANIFLGIYYNLSIWYKISNKTGAGAAITIGGAMITILVNYFFIARYGYVASAWATFLCYFGMTVACYIWGQKVYPVPYAWKKLLAYIVIVILLFLFHQFVIHIWDNFIFNLVTATLIFLAFTWFVLKVEKREFQKLPVIGRYIR
ncbi:MAG: oligosaccharide flippase family protein [Chitinophagaceae bacterium]|nr:oligosaccharide flippase family protein [Chitinophagaceae bacterium]MCW5925876.1 oligosaccharide flippase family protein [Chitinophagaceae bacterium]